MKLPKLMSILMLLIAAFGYYSQQAMALPSAGTATQFASYYALSSDTESLIININTATATELSRLPGIGAKKALAIVEYRELNGEFTSVEELTNVKGIGPKMLSKLDGKISI